MMAIPSRGVDRPKILTDNVETEPILDFKPYAEVITSLVVNSEPNFSIGIYGEWGTGKTTLMRFVQDLLTNSNILTVWFNAWRYEREDQLAIVALMKTIAYSMGEHESYKKVKPIILRGLKILGKDFLRQAASQFVSEKGIEEFEQKLLPKLELLAEVDKDTIYFDGVNKIEEEMKKIRAKNAENRVVVFIDDLDRCSPRKALEVFESIKVFLGIEGFIYVVGLSYETVSKLITAEYEKSGIKGENYIKKIIQIPIPLPEWNASDIHTLIGSLAAKLDTKYKDIVVQNTDIISIAVENNPRELKRFINSFILANELHTQNQKANTKELLICQALILRWPKFYILIANTTASVRSRIDNLAKMTDDLRIKALESNEKGFEEYGEARNLLSIYKNDLELWKFLQAHSSVIFGIKEWETYRRATALVKAAEYQRASRKKSQDVIIIRPHDDAPIDARFDQNIAREFHRGRMSLYFADLRSLVNGTILETRLADSNAIVFILFTKDLTQDVENAMVDKIGILDREKKERLYVGAVRSKRNDSFINSIEERFKLEHTAKFQNVNEMIEETTGEIRRLAEQKANTRQDPNS